VPARYGHYLGLLKLTSRGFFVGALAGLAVYIVLAQLILGHLWSHSR
jgi:hypothetical protein